MESVFAQVVAIAKLPVLNPGEFELWKMSIEQYFLMTDYVLWEVILNGDSSLPTRTVDDVETLIPPTTAEQKLARKNELKARGTLLMALPNEHQLKFNTYKSAKTLMEAIEKRFGGNKESKKVQNTLLKQYQLEIHGETISQEDVNLKLLRSLPSEWKTHTLIWRNKPDLENLSMDYLYNNLNIYEAEIMGLSSTNQNTQNIAFVSSNITSSTNEAVKNAHGVSAANSKNNVSTLPNVDSLIDAMIYSFFAKEIDMKWQMSMLIMRARRFHKKTGRNLGVNGTDTIGFDKTKVECYNCHRIGHFAREYRAPKNQDNRNRETIRRTMPVEETTSNALVSQCDGFGYDWSDRAEEGPTNFALMAYTSSGSSSSSSSDTEVSTCSKACLKSYETLKEHYDNLTKDFNRSQLNVGAYKAGLEFVEARLDVYKKNEAIFEEDIKIFKLEIMLRDNALTELRKKFEKDEKERDDLKLTLEMFENSSKNLRKLLDSQICDKFKSGVGYDSQVFNSQVFDSQVNDRYKIGERYHVVPPPYIGNFMPLKPNLVLVYKDEYVFSESTTSVPSATTSKVKTSVSKHKSVSKPLIEDWISDSENENETEFKSGQRKPSNAKLKFVKSNQHVKSPREFVKKVKNYKQVEYPRKTVKVLEKMVEKPVWNNARRVNRQNSQRITHPHPKRNFVPSEVLIKSGLKTLNTARQNSSRAAVSVSTTRSINTAYLRPTVNSARPVSNVFNRAHSHDRRPFNKFTTNKNSKFNDKVNTVKGNVTTVGPKAVVSDNKGNEANDVKALACWVWRLKQKVLDHGNPQIELQEKGVIDRGTKENIDARQVGKKTRPDQEYILLPLWTSDPSLSKGPKNTEDYAGKKVTKVPKTESGFLSKEDDKDDQYLRNEFESLNGENDINNDDEDVGAEVDMTNLDTHIPVSPIPTTKIHKDHPVDQIIGDMHLAPQTRRMTKHLTNHVEPKKVIRALTDPSWIEAMQYKLLQFKLQQVWALVDLPYGKRAIGTKWIYKNKKDERSIVVRNKARLVAQGYTQEEGLDYDEGFALVARIEAIRLFLAYASFKDFVVYQMDVKSEFMYGKIEEEVYVCQPLVFEDPEVKGDILLVQVYVDDIIFGFTKKALCIEFEKLMHKKFQMSSMGELTFFLGLQVTQKDDGIFISQDKYVDEILNKFGFSTMKTTSTPMETSKPLMKDENAEAVDVYLYRLMIGSLMYLTSSRPDIMFVVCACARFQVTPKVLHLYAVKRIFRYLKGQPKLGLWYPKDSPFDLEAYTNSDYVGASLDRKSTIGGSQFLVSRLISWQCKKQTMVANSTTEAEYVASSNCCGQVLWIQNQMLDYGYNFMNTKIFIDSESTICIVKNLVFHSKTKHIEIRYNFISDSYEKRLFQVFKIHTDHNVADLLKKAFNKKSESNVDFAEIVDFLIASSIRYALTISPTIYVSYIEQFWSTVKIKIVNNETQIRAKVDGKTIVITESSVRRDLHFDDEDGITCLTNTKIFENLQLMEYEKLSDKLTFLKPFFSPQWKYLIHTILQCLSSKSTAWIEFGTNIASAFICLAKNKKFNFSKLIFDVFNDEYDTPSHTKKVFANMRRQGKDFLGIVTPLFPSILASQAVEGKGPGQPTEPQHIPTTASPSHSSEPTNLDADEAVQEERGDNVERAATTATSLDAKQCSGGSPRCQEAMRDTIAQTRYERVSTPSYDSPLLGVNTPGSDEERIELKELMNMCTKLSDKGSAPIATVGVSVSTAKPSTPPTTTTTFIKDEDHNCSDLYENEKSKIKIKIKGKRNKGKGIMQKPEKPVKVKGKDQIEYDADMAKRLKAELDEEVRLEREREEEASNTTLIEEWDTIEARIDADA
ncbi:putative ribonuclease H-like domain-containing protein [Tanacetum coccineum]